MLQQIPSKHTDFPGNHPNVIQVHVTSASKDTTGNYHARVEITNNGNTTLNSVMVTVHFCGANGKIVADSLCCFTNPINIDPGHKAIFDSFAMANEISCEPVTYICRMIGVSRGNRKGFDLKAYPNIFLLVLSSINRVLNAVDWHHKNGKQYYV